MLRVLQGSLLALMGCAVSCSPSEPPSSSHFADAGDSGTSTCGGRVQPILIAAASMVSDIKVDTTSVYFAQQTVGVPAPIYQAPLCGGSSNLLGSVTDLVDACGAKAWIGVALALSGTDVYFLDGQGLGRVPKAGGEPTLLAAAECGWYSSGLVTNGTDVFWMQNPPSSDATIDRLSTDNGSPVPIATGVELDSATSTTDATSYYWSGLDGTINRIPLGGGPVSVLTQDMSGRRISGIAVDPMYAYFGLSSGCGGPISGGPSCPAPSPTAAAIERVPLSGGPATTVATDWDVAGVVVDQQNLYWIDPYTAVMWASTAAAS
jgi:hypothetical protein